jgi:hypothetical protein
VPAENTEKDENLFTLLTEMIRFFLVPLHLPVRNVFLYFPLLQHINDFVFLRVLRELRGTFSLSGSKETILIIVEFYYKEIDNST